MDMIGLPGSMVVCSPEMADEIAGEIMEYFGGHQMISAVHLMCILLVNMQKSKNYLASARPDVIIKTNLERCSVIRNMRRRESLYDY